LLFYHFPRHCFPTFPTSTTHMFTHGAGIAMFHSTQQSEYIHEYIQHIVKRSALPPRSRTRTIGAPDSPRTGHQIKSDTGWYRNVHRPRAQHGAQTHRPTRADSRTQATRADSRHTFDAHSVSDTQSIQHAMAPSLWFLAPTPQIPLVVSRTPLAPAYPRLSLHEEEHIPPVPPSQGSPPLGSETPLGLPSLALWDVRHVT
jgi:hypothetical protein